MSAFVLRGLAAECGATTLARVLGLAPIASLAAMATPAFAQYAPAPYADPYRAGPTRPFDGSPRDGRVEASAPAIWNGLYVGAQLGYRSVSTTVDSGGLSGISTAGQQAGAHLGYIAQFNQFVLGVESDLMLGGTSASYGSGGAALSVKDGWASTVRLRAGYAVGPVLIYATGGLAAASKEVSASVPGQSSHLADTRLGGTFGGGVEFQFIPHLSARIEGLRTNTTDSALSLSTGTPAVRQSSTSVRAGLSYHFN